jgi:hypothetical protein
MTIRQALAVFENLPREFDEFIKRWYEPAIDSDKRTMPAETLILSQDRFVPHDERPPVRLRGDRVMRAESRS